MFVSKNHLGEAVSYIFYPPMITELNNNNVKDL